MVRRRLIFTALVLGVTVSMAGIAAAATDFGIFRDGALANRSEQLFGVHGQLASSSTTSVTPAQAAADPTSLVTLASGLTAKVVSAGNAAPNIDQMVLWPNNVHPELIIACNEEGAGDPGLQRHRHRDRRGDDHRRRRHGLRSRAAAPPGERSCSARRTAAVRPEAVSSSWSIRSGPPA